MYDRFSDRARKVMLIANQTARHYRHANVDLCHILMGIIKERGMAVEILERMQIVPASIEMRLEALMQSTKKMGEFTTSNSLTPAAKTLIDYAIEEATTKRANRVGTEHILLALLRPQYRKESKCGDLTWSVLQEFGLNYEVVQEQLTNFIMGDKVKSQGFMDIFRLFDKKTIQRIEEIIEAIDVGKIKSIFDAVEVENGWVKVNLGIQQGKGKTE